MSFQFCFYIYCEIDILVYVIEIGKLRRFD